MCRNLTIPRMVPICEESPSHGESVKYFEKAEGTQVRALQISSQPTTSQKQEEGCPYQRKGLTHHRRDPRAETDGTSKGRSYE